MMKPMVRLCALALTMVGLAMALSACGSRAKASSRRSADTITIRNFKFGSPLSVKVGTTVTVKNSDATTHTVTADDKSFDTGKIQAGKTATIALSKAGTAKFHCDIHNYMTGSIKVAE